MSNGQLKRQWRAVLTFALTATGSAVALVALRDAPPRLARGLGHPRQWPDAAGADTAAATLAAAALWLLAAWVAVGLVAALAGRLPGAAGTLAQRIAAVALPRALYRAAAGAAGLGVLLSPAVASAATSHPAGTESAPASIAVPSPLPPTDAVPAPQLPIRSAPDARPPAVAPARPPEVAPGADAAQEAEPQTVTVTVRTGDSLWRIATTHLDRTPTAARVAAAWPRWFAANRAVIGPDPDFLVPGEVLHAPHSSEDQR